MQTDAFKNWLIANGPKTAKGLSSRIASLKRIETQLSQLGFTHTNLDAVYAADKFVQLRERIKQMRSDAKKGGSDFQILMPDSKDPLKRLSSWNSYLVQYGRFLGGDNSQADAIRHYVLEHYITPARERGDKSVTVVVGTLNNEMGLKQAWPNICQALEGQKFLELADVPPPITKGPKQSTTRTLTFSLAEEVNTVEHVKHNPINLILYGPPGTGKTYNTAQEAVKLCDGSADYDETQAEREDLMERYKQLKAEKRIAFVTFHQSYDYETFVEGLRPETNTSDLDGEATSSGGFRLVPTPGIFREMCALAEQARTRTGPQNNQANFNFDGRRFWKMSQGAGGSEESVYQDALTKGYITLGWGGAIDWSSAHFSSREAIRAEWIAKNPNDQTPSNWTQTYPFRCEMKPGDIVIVPHGNSEFRAVGKITGDYYFDSVADGYYAHRRPVEWLLTLDEPLPLDTIVDGNFTMRTLYSLDTNRINLPALARLLTGNRENGTISAMEGSPDQFVLIIDEINRANISKVFGELITLLEPDKRLGMDNELTVTLPYSKKQDFGVPANLHIVGTMNTADRSIALLDTALRRRFNFREMLPKPELLGSIDGIDLKAVLTTINQRIEYLLDREHSIGHAFFMGCKNKQAVEGVMRDKIIPLLQEYFFEDWSRIETVIGKGFIEKTEIAPPPGVDGDKRSSWAVRAEFKDNAFALLIGKTPKADDPTNSSIDDAEQ
ncbi:5-methylcytosine-specific restriction protein B [Agrobacterium vitis]|nr:5-methylcytosine-specific restriction protein B [Agrobacterium vitis]